MSKSPEWSPFKAYRSSQPKKWNWPDLALLALLGLFLIWTSSRASTLPGYTWNWRLLGEFILRQNSHGNWEAGLLLRGLFTTLRVGLWTLLLSFIIGAVIGMAGSAKSPWARLPCQIYVNLARNTPPLVILFCVYFFASGILPVTALESALRGLPASLRDFCATVFAAPGELDRMMAAILALGLYQGAYVAEIIRGGIASVPRGQWDASQALGFTRPQTLLHVILPQAARLMIPPLTGQAITTIKDSALASLISLPDLTFQSLEIMATSGMTFEVWISAGFIYLLVGAGCATLGLWLEKKFAFSSP